MRTSAPAYRRAVSGVRFGPSTFAIFDAFPDEASRQAHMAGVVAATLMGKAGDLLAQPPSIKLADVLASKLPGYLSSTDRRRAALIEPHDEAEPLELGLDRARNPRQLLYVNFDAVIGRITVKPSHP